MRKKSRRKSLLSHLLRKITFNDDDPLMDSSDENDEIEKYNIDDKELEELDFDT